MGFEVRRASFEEFHGGGSDAKEEQIVVVVIEEARLAFSFVVLLEGGVLDFEDYRREFFDNRRRNVEAFQILAREDLDDFVHEHSVQVMKSRDAQVLLFFRFEVLVLLVENKLADVVFEGNRLFEFFSYPGRRRH